MPLSSRPSTAFQANQSRYGSSRSFITASYGFTLVEILLVLGIIAVLAIAAFVIYPKVQASAQARAAASNITTIRAGVKELFPNHQYIVGPAYGDFTSTVVLAKIAPTSMVDSGSNTLHNIFTGIPGSVKVRTSIVPAADGTSAGVGLFDISYNYVPSDVCVKLATGVGSGFDNLYISSSSGSGSVFTTTAPFQLDPGLVASACSGDTRVTMEFISK